MVRRRAWLVLVLACLGATASCSTCDSGSGAPAHDAAVEPPVAEPAALLGEGAIATPDTTWARVQRGVGGVTALMAPTAGGLLASLAGADPALGAEIDGGAAAYVVAADVGGSPGFAVALRLKSGSRAREAVAADAGRHRFAADEGSLSIWEPADPSRLAIGIAKGGWIVLGRTREDVSKLGPYAYRTLPTRPLPKANAHFEVRHDALSRVGAQALAERWSEAKAFLLTKDAESRKEHGGREPDFGDAGAIVTLLDGWIHTRVDALADVAKGEVDVDIAQDDLQIKVALEPGAGASKAVLDSMRPGNLGLVGPVPWDTVAMIVTREEPAAREKNAHDAADAVTAVMGKRFQPGDGKQLDAALADFARARGDWLALNVTKRGLMVRTPAADGPASVKAVRSIVALTDKPALRAPLATTIGLKTIAVADADFAPVGKGLLATIARDPKVGPSFLEPKLDVGWLAHDGRLDVAAGGDADDMLTEEHFDDRPAKQLEGLGPDASFAVLGRWSAAELPSMLTVLRRDGKLVVLFDATFNFLRYSLQVATRGL